jgi:hypothetical protein
MSTNRSRVSPLLLVGIVTGVLLLSGFFFAPRLWIMRQYMPGSFQWDRAHAFLLQCEHPLRRAVEPAMFWRLLPPLAAHALRLPGNTPFVIPWLGLLAATGYVAVLLRRTCDDPYFVFGGTLLFATTSAVLVPVGWLGMNDAWVWLGLLAVAFGRSSWAAPLACLLCPWVDERFLIGFPLAWLLARQERGEPLFGRSILIGLWLSPYAVVRLVLQQKDPATAAVTWSFLHSQTSQSPRYLPLAPLGWWMGLRLAWAAVAYALCNFSRPRAATAIGVLVATLVISVLLAADLSRSVAIATPLAVAGCLIFARCHPERAGRWLSLLSVANLLVPAAHVTYTHIDPINPLPVELFRLLR